MPNRPYSGPTEGPAPVIQTNPDLTVTVYPFAFFGASGDDGATITTVLSTNNVVYLAPLTYTINSVVTIGSGQIIYQQPSTVIGGTGSFSGGSPYVVSTASAPLFLAPTGATSETVSRSIVTNNNVAPVSGTSYYHAVYLPVNTPVNNATFAIGGTATSTTTHSWYALLDSGGTVRSVSADGTTATLYQVPNTVVTKPMTSPAYVTTYSGLYYLGMCVTSSGTVPTFNGTTALASSSVSTFAPTLMATGGTGLTTPPATGSAITLTGTGSFQMYGYTS